MGYITQYEITVHFDTDMYQDEIKARLAKAQKKGDWTEVAKLANLMSDGLDASELFLAALNEVTNEEGFGIDSLSYEGKWYSYASHIRGALRRNYFPGITVLVEGHGENSGDIWRHKFTNTGDEKVKPELVWPEFTI